jgi:peptidoglycan/LPS O-acetylase OafA/YrhL
MYIAQLIRNDDQNYYHQRIPSVVEWITTIIGFSVFWLPLEFIIPENDVAWMRLINMSYRYFFSIAISVLILTSLSPSPEKSISWWRPSKYFRALMSLKLWLPIATLSYSVYLWHPIVFFALGENYTDIREQIEEFDQNGDC